MLGLVAGDAMIPTWNELGYNIVLEDMEDG